MPEGPQVRRAGNIIAVHAGHNIIEIKAPPSRRPWEIRLPVRIDKVDVVGKNIFIALEDGNVIYNHMLMWGSWRATCEPIGKKRLNTCFKTDKGTLGYFGGGILKLITWAEAAKVRSRLGPDLLRPESSPEVFKAVRESALAIGEALLAQELVSGIGNIYKSEGLFAARVKPTRKAKSLTSPEFERLFNFLHRQMTDDIKRTGPITTTTSELVKSGTRNFVYRRWHQPCILCGTKVERIYQGARPRSTYFCPKCQV